MSRAKVLLEYFTTWKLLPTPLEGVQAILAHAAGENSNTNPGLVNIYNANIVKDLYRKLRVPVIIQGELAPLLDDIPLAAVSLRQSESSVYLKTIDIGSWQKAECDIRNIKKVVMVSYYPHFWRAVKVAEKSGLEVAIPQGLKEIHDPANSQFWARHRALNRSYEILARLYFFKNGWI